MIKTNKVEIKLIKSDDGQFYNLNLKKINKLLDNLKPGHYKLIIFEESEKLTRLKKFYFSMESHLAAHLGMKKTELHKALEPFFCKLDENGKEIYDSIADIKDESSMMNRIIAFQEYAAREHNYKLEPYSEE